MNKGMRYKKAIILNGTLSGCQHEMIDSSLVMCFAEICERVDMYFQNDRGHIIQNLTDKHSAKSANINCHVIWNRKNWKSTFRELCGALQESWIFLIKADRETITCLTYINSFNGYLLNVLSKLTGKSLLLCCHGELEMITTPFKSSDLRWRKMMRYFYTNIRIAEHARLMIFGDHIKENIKPYLTAEKYDKYVAFEHLYYNTVEDVDSQPKLHTPVRIGVTGYVKKDAARGFDNIKAFARYVCKYANIELRILGVVEEELLPEFPKSIKLMNIKCEFIPRVDYDKMIQELDYILIPYPAGCFKMTASGALLDAIVKYKPVIMYANEYGMYLQKKYGEFAIVIGGNYDATLISMITDKENYARLYKNIRIVADNLTPENSSPSLKMIINSL